MNLSFRLNGNKERDETDGGREGERGKWRGREGSTGGQVNPSEQF